MFHSITNHKNQQGSISLKEFKRRQIYNEWTPVSLKDLSIIFEKYKDIILVTDKTNNFKLLKKEFKHSKRIIIETFGTDAYTRLRYMDYGVGGLSTDLNEKDYKFIINNLVPIIIIPTSALKDKRLEYIKNLMSRGVNVLAFTTNEEVFIHKFRRKVTAFYTDFWSISKSKCLARKEDCITSF